jgi:uncharacterized UPF0160 family protein
VVTLVTHSDGFHADELLAIALLQDTLLRDQPVTVMRTREEEALAKAKADPAVFVIDVGLEHEPTRRNFDHHQSLTIGWPDGTPFSACGLVWRWLRAQGALQSWGEMDVLDALEERIVRPADRHDNGVGQPWPEGVMLMGYNRTAKDPVLARHQFDRALEVARDLWANVRLDVQKDMEACRRMSKALREPIHAEGLVVIEDMRSARFPLWAARLTERSSPHRPPLHVNLVLDRRKPDQWNVVSLPVTASDPFSCRCPTPEAWRGRSAWSVITPQGEVEVAFCHKSGHLTVVQGTLEQAIAVAECIQAQAAKGRP